MKAMLNELIGKISIEKLITAVVLFVLLIVISRVAAGIFKKVMSKTRMTESVSRFVNQVIKFVLYFISILIVCDFIGIPVTSLVALFSLFGLAISLSVQSLLGNLMSGISILMLKPFDIGDCIETDVVGTVKNIGLFYTEIVTVDNKKIYIPNEKVIANRLINYTSEGTRRLDLVFNAGYDCDTEAVKAALKEAVDSVPQIIKTKEPVIGISEFGDSAIMYSVCVWVEAKDFVTAKLELMDAVWDSYKKNGISMAYNRLEVEMVNNK